MLDLETLLTPLDDVNPCGPDLEYDPDFLRLNAVVQGKEEQRVGHSIRPAVEPDWRAARELSVALLGRTKDLRVAVYLLRAELHLDGLPALATGLQLVAGLLNRYEATVHPRLDAEEYGDATLRYSALYPLGQPDAVLADLRGMHFGDPGSGITGRCIEPACDPASPREGERCPSTGDVYRALRQEEQRSPGLWERLGEARNAARIISGYLAEHRWDSRLPVDLSGLRHFLESLLDTAREALDSQAKPQPVIPSGTPRTGSGQPAGQGPEPAGRQESGPGTTAIAEFEPLTPLDIEALLAPIDSTEPCGPDLEYEPQFQELERAARGRPEQQFGEFIVPAEPPDWRSVRALSLALFSRGKDLRVAVHLLRAATRLGGIDAAVAGLKLIHGLLARYWDSVHPILDPEDDHDPTQRLNVLAELADARGFLADLGELGVEAAVDTGPASPETKVPETGRAEQPPPAPLERTAELLECAQAIAGVLGGQVDDRADVLQPLLRFLEDSLGVAPERFDPARAQPPGAGGSEFGASGRTVPEAALDDTGEALAGLARIRAWFDQAALDPARECRRARRMATTNFLTIVDDLTPASADQIEKFFHRPEG